MTNYTELVKALKTCQSNRFGCITCAGCPMSCKCLDNIDCINALHKDAAAAIDELEKERDYYKQQYENRQRLIKCALGEEWT